MPPSRSWMSAGWTMAWSNKPSVSTRTWRFLPLIFCPHHSHADRCRPPFFGAFHALAVDDGSARARFAFGLLAARDIECMVDAIESAVATPKYKIVMYRALWRKVLGQCAPLTTRAQDVHDPVHHLPDINRSFVAARLDGRDQRRDMRPFLVRQITRISQPAAVVTFAILRRPHR